jgi:hypothetical protein
MIAVNYSNLRVRGNGDEYVVASPTFGEITTVYFLINGNRPCNYLILSFLRFNLLILFNEFKTT